jgi:hypothetical protein
MHNYPESSSVQGRTANWQLLNKKALKKLHFELNAQLIDVFVNRKSIEQAQTFLRMLRAKMIAYEPIYATLSFTDEDGDPTVFEKLNKLAPPPIAHPVRRSSVVSTATSTTTAAAAAATSISASTVKKAGAAAINSSSTSSLRSVAKDPTQHRPSMATTNALVQRYCH